MPHTYMRTGLTKGTSRPDRRSSALCRPAPFRTASPARPTRPATEGPSVIKSSCAGSPCTHTPPDRLSVGSVDQGCSCPRVADTKHPTRMRIEDAPIEVGAEAGRQRFTGNHLEGAPAVVVALCPQEHRRAGAMLVEIEGEVVEVGDRNHGDPPFPQSLDDLSVDLRPFPLVGGGKRFV